MYSNQLPVPPAAEHDPKSRELLRVLAAQGQQHISLATRVWNDPAVWGIMLVDLAKHIASAYEQGSGKKFAEVLKQIKAGFDAEWDTATDEPRGTLLK